MEAVVGNAVEGHPPGEDLLGLSRKWLSDAVAMKRQSSTLRDRVIGFALATHVLAGQREAFDQWVADLGEDEAKLYKESQKSPLRLLNSYSRIPGLTKKYDEGKPTLAEFLFRALATEPTTAATLFTSINSMRNLARSGFTDEELLVKILEETDGSLARRGLWQITRELLRAKKSDTDENRATAIAALEKLADRFTEDGDHATALLAKIYQAEQLGYRNKHPETALAITGTLDLTSLDESTKKYIEGRIVAWKKAAKKNAEAEAQ